jgi:aminopeptidase N
MIRKILAIVIVYLFGVGIVLGAEPGPGSDGLGDPYDPDLGNGGYDAQHYTLTLDVDVEANVIDAIAQIDAQATQDLSQFNFDLMGLEVENVLVNGEPAEFSRSEDELTITPGASLPADTQFSVEIHYGGTPVTITEDLPNIGWVRYATGIYVASEPSGAATWYPVNNHPLDKATYTYIVTVPEPYSVAANGLLQDTQENADGTRTFTWENDHVMASYLATIAIADFVVETQEGPNGLPIRNYLEAHIAPTASQQLINTDEMIEYYESILGPYPFEAYGVVYVDAPMGFLALETQTLSLFGASNLDDPTVEETVAHELAHQWFGDSISLTRWEDIWLNEGFATYVSYLWFEHRYSREVLDDTMEGYYGYLSQENFTPGRPGIDGLFNAGVYLQGAWTLHALRLEVGDEAFFEILRTYVEQYSYENATTEDFIAIAEEVSGEELGELFNAWLFAGGVPELP